MICKVIWFNGVSTPDDYLEPNLVYARFLHGWFEDNF